MRVVRFLTIALTVAGMHASEGQCSFISTLGVESEFVEPAGWSVGDPLSTSQIWDFKTAATGNVPDQGYDVGGASLTSPTHSVVPPGFVTGTHNFYSFSGNFGATADIYNHGPFGAGFGTHVIVQIGATVNPDEESFPGHGTSAYLNSLDVTDLLNNPIGGGTNSDALQISEVSYRSGVTTVFGDVDYQELIFEFWLDNYTSDFRIAWDGKVHSTFDTLRVDSMIGIGVAGNSPFALTVVPEPSSIVLIGVAGISLPLAHRIRRKRSQTIG